MPTSLFTLIIIGVSAMAITACGSSGWGVHGNQQSGSTQTSGSAHTLTGGAEAAPTSVATLKPAGPKEGSTSESSGSGGTGGSMHPTQ